MVMETINFLMALNYWPVGLITLALLIAASFLIILLFVRSLIQGHDLKQLQKREAVLLKIKDKKDTQEYYNKILLSNVQEPGYRRGLL